MHVAEIESAEADDVMIIGDLDEYNCSCVTDIASCIHTNMQSYIHDHTYYMHTYIL